MYLGIDCGTQGTKAVIWHEGKVLSSAYTCHPLIQNDNGQREQSPEWWVDAMESSINQAFTGFENLRNTIKGIGISGQQHGLVLLDQHDNVICNALLWCDTRPEHELKEFETSKDINIAKEIGIHVPVAFTISKLLWIKRHNPAAFSQIHKILLPHDYLNFRLTGRYAIEVGDASGTGWFNTNNKTIEQRILSLLNLPDRYRLPEVCDSHAVFGRITPEFANKFGFNSNVIVSSGGGDNMMAAIGTGNVDSGMLTISLGTSGTAFGHSQKQIESQNHPDINGFCSSSGGYLPLVSTMNVTTANNQILSTIGKGLNEFDQLLGASSIGSEGLVSLPFYNGARLPNVPSATGALLNMTANNVTQENLLRATVEGVTYNLSRGIDTLRQAGVKFDRACVIGGGANSRVWRQLIADVTDLTLLTPQCSEAAATGGALQALWAKQHDDGYPIPISDICQRYVQFDNTDTITPNPTHHAQYKVLSQRYHQTVDQYLRTSFT
ncbi:xylulokinase [Vibrio sp. E150_011]